MSFLTSFKSQRLNSPFPYEQDLGPLAFADAFDAVAFEELDLALADFVEDDALQQDFELADFVLLLPLVISLAFVDLVPQALSAFVECGAADLDSAFVLLFLPNILTPFRSFLHQ